MEEKVIFVGLGRLVWIQGIGREESGFGVLAEKRKYNRCGSWFLDMVFMICVFSDSCLLFFLD